MSGSKGNMIVNTTSFPRILIISNECLSETGSNGRTIFNLVSSFPKDNIAQFYVSKEKIDPKICNNFFNVTDEEALASFLFKKKKRAQDGKNGVDKPRKVNRNALTSLIRDIVWNSYRWGFNKLIEWAKSFKPDVILFQAGDSAFLCKLTLKVSKQLNLPIVIYNSENYFFKNFDYFRSNGIRHLFYPVYHSRFKKAFSKLIKQATSSIYISEYLKEEYDKKFGLSSYVIYTATSIEPKREKKRIFNNPPIISYFGNINLGRNYLLNDIGTALGQINKEYNLNVYSNDTDKNIYTILERNNNIKYNGRIPYSKVLQKINERGS